MCSLAFRIALIKSCFLKLDSMDGNLELLFDDSFADMDAFFRDATLFFIFSIAAL